VARERASAAGRQVFFPEGTGDGGLTENSERASYPSCDRWGQWEELAMKTITLTYVIALGGVAMIVFGIYCLIKERAAELRSHIPAIQTIAVGVVLIGLARAVQLLLLILVTSWVAAPRI